MEPIKELKGQAFEIAANSNLTFSLRIEAMKAYANLCLADNSFGTKRLLSNLLTDLIEKRSKYKKDIAEYDDVYDYGMEIATAETLDYVIEKLKKIGGKTNV